MLGYSVRMHERIIRQVVPDASEVEIDQIVYTWCRVSPFHFTQIFGIQPKGVVLTSSAKELIKFL